MLPIIQQTFKEMLLDNAFIADMPLGEG